MCLNRAIDNSECNVWGDHFDSGDLGASTLVADGIHQPCRLHSEQAGLFDFDAGIGDPFLNDALLGKWLTESNAFGDSATHEFKRAFSHADAPHAVMNAARTETGLCKRKAAAFFAENVGNGYANIVELQLTMAFAIVVSEHHEIAHNGKSGCVHGYEHHRLLRVRGSRWISFSHHDCHTTTWVCRARNPPFTAI